MRNQALRGDAPLKIKIDAESGFAWQRRIWALARQRRVKWGLPASGGF